MHSHREGLVVTIIRTWFAWGACHPHDHTLTTSISKHMYVDIIMQVFCDQAKLVKASNSRVELVAADGCVSVLCVSPGSVGRIVDLDKLDLMLLNLKDVGPPFSCEILEWY